MGVVTADGRHLLLDSGPLPEAVAASAAIPFVFQAVDVPGGLRSCVRIGVNGAREVGGREPKALVTMTLYVCMGRVTRIC